MAAASLCSFASALLLLKKHPALPSRPCSHRGQGRGDLLMQILGLVSWMAGDVFYRRWDEVLVGATAVVSTLGGFGNEEQMKKINGENLGSRCLINH